MTGVAGRRPQRSGLQAAVEGAAARAVTRHTGCVVAAVDAERGACALASAGRTSLPDGPRPGPDTLFEIGSITKVFTALVLADAVARGEVALDTPLREVLPGVAVPARNGVAITLEHLATHTSGLPRSPLGATAELVSALFTRANPYAELTRDGLFAALARTRLQRTPGTGRIAYSNFGAAVLGHALVAATGADDYATLVHERICAPLGLPDTVVTVDAARRPRLADGHRKGRRPHRTGSCWRWQAPAGCIRPRVICCTCCRRSCSHEAARSRKPSR